MSYYSPPSPGSPPEWLVEARLEAERRRQQDIKNKKTYINLILVGLNKFPKNEPIIVFFSTLIASNIGLEKRYKIAQAINTITDKLNLANDIVQSLVIKQIKTDIFNQESTLYTALNYQRNGPLAFTFLGSMSLVGCNYARSLQAAQAMVLEEQKESADDNILSFIEMSP